MTAARTRFAWWMLAAIVAAVVVIAAIIGFSRREEIVAVTVANAAYQDVKQEVTTNGVVIPTKEFQARAFWPGIIESVDVHLGQRVKAGQMLVSLKDPFATSRITSANAAYQSAQLAYQNTVDEGSQEERIALAGDLEHAKQSESDAVKSLAALQKLRKEGAAAQAEVDAAEQRLRTARTTLSTLQQKKTRRYSSDDLRSAKARVADARANLDSAKSQYDNAHIRTPMAGTVYSVRVVAYDFVPVGADLIRVADLQHVEVRAYFDEPEVGKLAVGQPVQITWDGEPGRVWHGSIRQAPVAATALGPRSVGECVISVDDANEDLLPNTNVVVAATIKEHSHVLAVPRAALRTDGNQDYVFKVSDGRIRRVTVKSGIVSLNRVEITSGLVQGDEVVVGVAGNAILADGVRVRDSRRTLQ